MKVVFVLFVTAVVISCNNSGEQVTEEIASNGASSTISESRNPTGDSNQKNISPGCYMKITGRDTAIVMLDQSDANITGKMLYDNFEKDGSHGTLKGKADGDILKLYYDFNSEGMRSVMEVYFKLVPGGLLRGSGDMNVKGDTTYFTSGINYSDKEAFSKIDCDKLKGKFQ